ncbi:MAG TPA: GerMN domain-containing protein [Terriglobia bacterium]|nr:GerMN domain-containing protein [Terriglobia bacterium]
MSRRTKILLLLLVPVLVVGSLYLRTLVRWAFFERRAPAENAARAKLNQAALQATAGPAATVALYFPFRADEKLHAETRALALAADPTDRIRQVVLALIEGPTQGGARALPASADVRGVFLTADGTAYLDLSASSLGDFNAGIESETLALYAVVDSLTANLPEVKRVQFLVEGQEVDTLDGHADLSAAYAPNPAWIASAPSPAPAPAPASGAKPVAGSPGA